MSRRSSFDQLEAASTLSPESTTKTADSGIESLANRLSEDQNLSSSMGSTPEPATTGNEQVDMKSQVPNIKKALGSTITMIRNGKCIFMNLEDESNAYFDIERKQTRAKSCACGGSACS